MNKTKRCMRAGRKLNKLQVYRRSFNMHMPSKVLKEWKFPQGWWYTEQPESAISKAVPNDGCLNHVYQTEKSTSRVTVTQRYGLPLMSIFKDRPRLKAPKV